MGIPASPFGCTDLNITVFGYRLFIISHELTVLSSIKCYLLFIIWKAALADGLHSQSHPPDHLNIV